MRRQAMTVWTSKTSSDFRNKLFLDISLDGINGLDDIEESLSCMELRPGTGCPDTSVTESLNTFWQNTLKEKTQELDGINRFGESLTVTILGILMGTETKHDYLSVEGNDLAKPESIISNVRANEMSANRTEQNRTEQNRTEQNRTEQNRTEQNRTEQNRYISSSSTVARSSCCFAQQEGKQSSCNQFVLFSYFQIPEWKFNSLFRDLCF